MQLASQLANTVGTGNTDKPLRRQMASLGMALLFGDANHNTNPS